MSYFSFNLEIKDSLAFGTMKELIDLKDIRLFVCERQFASTCRVASDLLGTPFKLAEIHVAYPEPAHATMYKDIFGCAVMFNADYHTLVFDKSYLYKPLPMANPLARKTYEKECRELSQRIKNQETISQRVSQEIFYRKDGIPDLDHLARHLNTSTRTLRRRLKEEGTSYKEIVASIQKNKAVELLQSTSMSVEQIALFF